MQLGMRIHEDGWPLLFSVYSTGNDTLVIEIILLVTLCSIDQLPPACWWGQLRASVAGSLRRFKQYHANKMLYCCVSLTEPYIFFNNMIKLNLGSHTKLNSHTIKTKSWLFCLLLISQIWKFQNHFLYDRLVKFILIYLSHPMKL